LVSVLAVLSGLASSIAGCGSSSDQPASKSSATVIERKAEKGPVKLSVKVSPREPRLSDLLDMDVRVEAAPGVEIRPPAFGQAVGDFLVRDYSERTPTAVKAGGNVRQFHYQLEPVHAGKHLIRSVSIEFVDRRSDPKQSGTPTLIETDPLEVTVTSDLAEGAPSLANLEPMLPPRSVPRSGTLGWVLGGIAAIFLATLAIVARRRRKERMPEPPRQTPEEIAEAALARLMAENLPSQGLIKEFYLRLTGIVRRYVEDTTGLRAPEQTTEEFLREMRQRSDFPADRSARLAEFLEAADLVKYAGQTPGEGQIDQAIARAYEFVNVRPPAEMAVAAFS
jgi:hypothetical protein